jgi:hypothetical protein
MRVDLLDLGSSELPAELRDQLAPPHQTPEGFWIVEGLGARAGTQVYQREDGAAWVEYRPPEEVQAADSIASWEGRPYTPQHPVEDGRYTLLTANNAWRHTCGAVLSAQALGDWVKARIAIYDASAQAAIQGGARYLSAGYRVDLDLTPGTAPDGTPYHAVQRRIRLNHLAGVDNPRAGRGAQLRLDSADAPLTPTTGAKMAKIKIGTQELEVADIAAPIITAELTRLDGEVGRLRVERDQLTARLDEQKARLDSAASPDAIKKAVSSRIKVISAALMVCPQIAPDIERLDSDEAIQRAALEKLRPGIDLKDRSPEYIAARFDAACEEAPQRHTDALRGAAPGPGSTAPAHGAPRHDAATQPPRDLDAVNRAAADRYR